MIAMIFMHGLATGLLVLAVMAVVLVFARWDERRLRARRARREFAGNRPHDRSCPAELEWAARAAERDLERKLGLPAGLEVHLDRRPLVSRQSEASLRVAEHRGDLGYLKGDD